MLSITYSLASHNSILHLMPSLINTTENIRKALDDENLGKNSFACLFSIHNIISLSCQEQVCLTRLCFEGHFSQHWQSHQDFTTLLMTLFINQKTAQHYSKLVHADLKHLVNW